MTETDQELNDRYNQINRLTTLSLAKCLRIPFAQKGIPTEVKVCLAFSSIHDFIEEYRKFLSKFGLEFSFDGFLEELRQFHEAEYD